MRQKLHIPQHVPFSSDLPLDLVPAPTFADVFVTLAPVRTTLASVSDDDRRSMMAVCVGRELEPKA